MRIFVTRWFARFARREGIADADLREAVRRAESGLVDTPPEVLAELTVDLAGFLSARLIEPILIHHPDLKAVNSADAPDVVKPQLQNGSLVEEGRLLCRLKPRSYNLIRLSV